MAMGMEAPGSRLRRLRIRAGLTQEELAERAELSARTIRNLECGRTLYPYRNSVRRLAGALGLDDAAAEDLLVALRPPRNSTESGTSPGPAVPEHDFPAPPAPPGQCPWPRQLPATTRHFVGRQAELSALTSLLGSGDGEPPAVVISAIDGTAGVGKTALAVHWAHQVAARFPDGQLYVNLRGYAQASEPRSAGEALEGFLRALGVPPGQIPHDVDERAALFRQRLAGTRTLILLDNAVSEAQVRPLLPGACGCLVLVTSRRRLKGLDDAHVLALDVLPQADALALMRAVAGSGRAEADDLVLAEIVELCERLPLALRIAAALLRHRPAWPVEHLAGLLGDQRHRIRVLSDGERDLGAVLDLSYRNLCAAQQLLFRRLGVIPGLDIDAYAAAALTSASPADSAFLLEDLVDHNLLIQHLPGRYRLHDLIRLHAQALAGQDPARDRDAALGRLLEYYEHTAGRADATVARTFRPALAGPAPAHAPVLPDADAARSWLRTERANLLAGARYSISHGYGEHAIALIAGLTTVLRADGPWLEAIDLHAAAAAVAKSLGDRLGQAGALARRGDVRALTGDFAGGAADLKQALRLFGELGEQAGQAHALTRLGDVKRLTGHYQGAARDLEQALQLFRELGEQAGQAHCLTRLGAVKRLTGDCQGAARDLEQALRLFRELGEQIGESSALAFLGQVRLSAGDFPGAANALKQALDLCRRIGARGNEAWAMNHYAAVFIASGDYTHARTIYQDALHLTQETHQLDDEALALEGIGECELRAAGTESGIAYLKQAIEIFQRLAMKPDVDRVGIRLAQLHGCPMKTPLHR